MNYEKETTGISTYVSLCSGYDGIGIGLKRAIPNLRTIAHCEIEAYAVANLIAKMEAGQLDACPVFTDLKTFPYRELRDRVTVLSAGFPCQPFSSAGKRQATEDPRHLYPWIADGITAMRPRYVLLENVEGIISAKTGDGESVSVAGGAVSQFIPILGNNPHTHLHDTHRRYNNAGHRQRHRHHVNQPQ